MKNHTSIYTNFFGYQIPSDCVCEICGCPAVDVHHIEARKMGGNPSGDKDVIENLMGLCRECHTTFGDYPEYKPRLKVVHLNFIDKNGLASQVASMHPPIRLQLKHAYKEYKETL